VLDKKQVVSVPHERLSRLTPIVNRRPSIVAA